MLLSFPQSLHYHILLTPSSHIRLLSVSEPGNASRGSSRRPTGREGASRQQAGTRPDGGIARERHSSTMFHSFLPTRRAANMAPPATADIAKAPSHHFQVPAAAAAATLDEVANGSCSWTSGARWTASSSPS